MAPRVLGRDKSTTIPDLVLDELLAEAAPAVGSAADMKVLPPALALSHPTLSPPHHRLTNFKILKFVEHFGAKFSKIPWNLDNFLGFAPELKVY